MGIRIKQDLIGERVSVKNLGDGEIVYIRFDHLNNLGAPIAASVRLDTKIHQADYQGTIVPWNNINFMTMSTEK